MNSGAVWRLTELAVHDIDLIEFIIGKRIEHKSIYISRKIHNHYEDNAVISFQLENNIVASITINWLTPFNKRTFSLVTADAYFEAG
jgi:UDP-N-acetylglucosamine 3-dehydrogenase